MIRRAAAPYLRGLLRRYPAVALAGPRQCGKTTLARSLTGRYFDLESGEQRNRLDLEWEMLQSGRELLILDEAQEHPALFQRLRGSIDVDRRRNGRFLLLGSVSPGLRRNISESLAGRLALCELAPFSSREVKGREDALWRLGGFPDGGIRAPRRYPEWQRNYLQLLTERDLPRWGFPAAAPLAMRFMRMVAASHGNVWNASDLGRSLGVSYHTVNGYLDFLEGAYLVRKLLPFHANIHKRLVKNPKVYWRDSGLLHALLGAMPDTLLDQPWVGASWEGFVIEQILAALSAGGRHYDAWFFRTSDEYEADLVIEMDGRRWAIEIKLTAAPTQGEMDRLRKVSGMIKADRSVLISRTSAPAGNGVLHSTNMAGAVNLLMA